MQSKIMQENYGVTRQALTKGIIEGFDIPVAPQREQRRIVAKIDALSTRSRRARTDLDRVEALAARAKQAVLSRIFRDPVRTVPLETCTPADAPICYGVIQPGDERGSGIPLIGYVTL